MNPKPFLLLGLSLLLGACSHSSTVRQRAAFDLDCSEDQVTVSPAGDNLLADGCGRKARYTCRTINMYSYCASASPPAKDDPPSGATRKGAAENRAVEDLGCPEEQIEVVKLGYRIVGARGCGKRVSYTCKQKFWRYWCYRDSEVQSTGE